MVFRNLRIWKTYNDKTIEILDAGRREGHPAIGDARAENAPEECVKTMSVRANGRRAPKCASGGFSIVELLVVVAIIAIMIGISIFSLPTAQRSLNVDFAVAQLVDVLRFASQRALAERQMMRVEISPSTYPDLHAFVSQRCLAVFIGRGLTAKGVKQEIEKRAGQ